jgi:hypothetical protein
MIFEWVARRRRDRQARADLKLFSRFVSLGDDCEFGMVQTHFEANHLGLCRSAYTPFAGLMRMLETRFAGLMDPTLPIHLDDKGTDYASEIAAFGTRYHTKVKVPADEAQLIGRERQRLALLARLLIDELEGGEKIFVLKSAQPLERRDVEGLRDLVRAYGPSTVLWVSVAGPRTRPGDVEWLGPGLMRGHIAAFAPTLNPFEADVAAWRELCRSAWALARAGAKAPEAPFRPRRRAATTAPEGHMAG